MSELKGAAIFGQSGGPTSVINASAAGVFITALQQPCITKVYGAAHGIKGILDEVFYDMAKEDPYELELLKTTPSSALGSVRYKLKDADVDDTDYKRLLEVFKKYDIRYFFYNGGNDSMDTCYKIEQLSQKSGYELASIGIPKTIDNDLDRTDHCPGYGSAARFIANNTRDLWMEVRAMPLFVTIMETMGRNAGWLAAAAGVPTYNGAPCAQLIYLPERTFNRDAFLADVDNLLHRQREILIVVSEGLTDSSGSMISDLGMVDGFGHKLAGGSAQVLCDLVSEKLGVRARAERHGFLGRASMLMQSSQDRDEAIAVGRHALRLAMDGISGVMVAIRRESDHPYRYALTEVPLEDVANRERTLPDSYINAAGNGVTEAFREYCLPLLGEPFPPYAVLR